MKEMLKLLLGAAALQTVFGGMSQQGYKDQMTARWSMDSCGGSQQSPILLSNVPAPQSMVLDDANKLTASYTEQPAKLDYSGKVSPDSGSFGDVTYAGKTYRAIQFHVHFPSEYAVADGTPNTTSGLYDGVVHVVHQELANGTDADKTNDYDDLLVIGRFLTTSSTSNDQRGFFDNIGFADIANLDAPADHRRRLGTSDMTTTAEIDLSGFLGVSNGKVQGEYWRYEGSLTTPPCTESVEWFVLTEPVMVSAAHMAAYKGKFPYPTNRLLEPVYKKDNVSTLYKNKMMITRDQYECPKTTDFRMVTQCTNKPAAPTTSASAAVGAGLALALVALLM